MEKKVVVQQLRSGTLYKRNDSWHKTFSFKIEYIIDDISNYGLEGNKYYYDMPFKLYMEVPPGMSLGPWTDWDKSYIEFNGNTINFEAGLPNIINYNGPSNKVGTVYSNTVRIYADSNGNFTKNIPVTWYWGVRAYRQQYGTNYYTENEHFWNPSGSFKLEELSPHPNAKPSRIPADSIKANFTSKKERYGIYKLDISHDEAKSATEYKYRVDGADFKNGSEIDLSNKNGSNIEISVIPYNGNISGETSTKEVSHSWPTVYIKEGNYSFPWKVGRVWIKQDNTWKLCEDEVYTRVEDKWKKAKHI